MANVSMLSHGAHSVADPAFEPDATFLFEEDGAAIGETSSTHHHRNSQSDVRGDAVNTHREDSPFLTTELTRAGRKRSSPFNPQHGVVPISPQSPLHSHGKSSGSHMLSEVQDVEMDLVENHDRSVSHFGQITPPTDQDETRLDISTKAFRGPHDSIATSSTSSNAHSKLDADPKSERARHAANHRHSKTKRVKSVDQDSDSSAVDVADGDGAEHKRERYREKNRLAAAKCRAKKKLNSNSLEGSARETERENTRLKLEERKLRDELTQLKEATLAHHPGRCTCDSIHQYITGQALRTAQGAQAGVLRGQQPQSPLTESPSPNNSNPGCNEPAPGILSMSSAPSAQNAFPNFNNPPQQITEPFMFSQKDFPQYIPEACTSGNHHEHVFMGGLLGEGPDQDHQPGDGGGAFANFLDSIEGEQFEFDC